MTDIAHDVFKQGESKFSFRVGVKPDGLRIKTARTCLRPISLDDTENVFTEFNHEVSKHMTPRPASKIEETRAFLESAISGLNAGTDLQLVIECKETGQFFGLIGLHTRFGTREPEVGLWLKISAQGKGLGKEAVFALKNWADENLDYDNIVYPVSVENIASRKIPESLGLEPLPSSAIVERDGGRKAITLITYKIPRELEIPVQK